jgi:hypothetical protein
LKYQLLQQQCSCQNSVQHMTATVLLLLLLLLGQYCFLSHIPAQRAWYAAATTAAAAAAAAHPIEQLQLPASELHV